jgi:hypothetical protein
MSFGVWWYLIHQALGVFGGLSVIAIGLSRWVGKVWLARATEHYRSETERELQEVRAKHEKELKELEFKFQRQLGELQQPKIPLSDNRRAGGH